MKRDFWSRLFAHLKSNAGEWKQQIFVTRSFGQTDPEIVFDEIADWILQKTLTNLSDGDTIQEPAKRLCSSDKEEK